MPSRLMSPYLLLSKVLGEYPAFITVTAFVVDSILAGGAVARSWSSYLAVLVRNSSLQPLRTQARMLKPGCMACLGG